MKFLISLNYGILTSLKDTVIITPKHSGAEVIPVLKGWIVLPVAFVAAMVYSKLSNIFKRSTLFYGVISAFLLFFLIYGFFLYPNQDVLCPKKSVHFLQQLIGSNHLHWIAIYRYWMHTLFFIGAELWGSIVIFLLFWGFSNQIIHFKEAKRFYTIFSAGGNLAAIITGPIVWYYVKKFIDTSFDATLQHLLVYVMIIGIFVMLTYFWIHRFVLTDKRFYDKEKIKQKAEEKTKLSLSQGFKYVAQSKYLRSLAIMVICYGLTINLIEVTWKANLKLHYPNPANYQYFMGTLSTFVGIVSFFLALFGGSSIIRFLGWKKSAFLCPMIIGSTGMVFLFLVYSKQAASVSSLFHISPLFLIVLFGAFQNITTKALKYSVFDPTKEMAFIPLDQESKVKGKAAIDVIGSRLGKSSSAWLQILLIDIIGTGSILSVTPLLLPLVFLTVVCWSFAIKKIDIVETPILETST